MLGVALERAGLDVEWWLLAVALATTSLGTLVPVLSDANLLAPPFGRAVLGTGVAGEFWPIIFISIFLASVYGAITEVLLLLGFGVLVAGAARLALGARPPSFVRVVRDTLHTTGQVGVRASIFFLALLVFVAGDAGFEFVLGAFAAGLVVGLVLDSPEGRVVRLRLEGSASASSSLSTSSSRGWPSTSTASSPWTGSRSRGSLGLLLVTRGASALLWLSELGARRTASRAFVRRDRAPARRRYRRDRAGTRGHLGCRRRLAHRRGACCRCSSTRSPRPG